MANPSSTSFDASAAAMSAPIRNRPDPSLDGVRAVFYTSQHHGMPRLPEEVVELILRLAFPPQKASQKALRSMSRPYCMHPALQPPANGNCPFMTLPVELRRLIITELLPVNPAVIEPTCLLKAALGRALKHKSQRNKTSTLMLICKRLKEEVSVYVYEERVFEVHVHEGLTAGGIEFLDTGLQPLQYQNSVYDDRFARFGNSQDFGFSKLKKIVVSIMPAVEKTRHSAINSYYMNVALVRLLDRGGESNRIVSLCIVFCSAEASSKNRHDIIRSENSWWDPEKNEPRSTSIHGVTDIELALRPFAMLSTVHNVNIILPNKVDSHIPSVQFVQTLTCSMTSNTHFGILPDNDLLEQQAEILRSEVEEHVFREIYGRKAQDIKKLTADDMDDSEDDTDDSSGRSYIPRASMHDQKRRKTDGDNDSDECSAHYMSNQEDAFSDEEDYDGGHRLGTCPVASDAPSTSLLRSLHAVRSQRHRSAGANLQGNDLFNDSGISILGSRSLDTNFTALSGLSRPRAATSAAAGTSGSVQTRSSSTAPVPDDAVDDSDDDDTDKHAVMRGATTNMSLARYWRDIAETSRRKRRTSTSTL